MARPQAEPPAVRTYDDGGASTGLGTGPESRGGCDMDVVVVVGPGVGVGAVGGRVTHYDVHTSVLWKGQCEVWRWLMKWAPRGMSR